MGIFPPCSSLEMLEKLLGSVCGKTREEPKTEERKIRGTVLLMKKNVMEMTDVGASFLDRVHEIVGKGVTLQLISASHADPGYLFHCPLEQHCFGKNLATPFFDLFYPPFYGYTCEKISDIIEQGIYFRCVFWYGNWRN